jgi:hypothetical protein
LKRTVYTILLFLTPFISGVAQFADRHTLIQVNGIITDDEKNPVPRVSIISRRLRKGTISEQTGIYSLISLPGDTVYVSALGYKRFTFQVPLSLDGRLYKKDLSLVSDTISIEGVSIFPWKSYGEFKKEFLANQPVMTPQIQNMYDNLASIRTTLENTPSYISSPEAGYRMAMHQVADANYTRGQSPANNLLNPFAWAKFFSGVKNGLLKNEKSPDKVKKAKVIKQSKSKSRDENTEKS